MWNQQCQWEVIFVWNQQTMGSNFCVKQYCSFVWNRIGALYGTGQLSTSGFVWNRTGSLFETEQLQQGAFGGKKQAQLKTEQWALSPAEQGALSLCETGDSTGALKAWNRMGIVSIRALAVWLWIKRGNVDSRFGHHDLYNCWYNRDHAAYTLHTENGIWFTQTPVTQKTL